MIIFITKVPVACEVVWAVIGVAVAVVLVVEVGLVGVVDLVEVVGIVVVVIVVFRVGANVFVDGAGKK